MKITKVLIQNFGPYADMTAELGQYNILLGPNGGGKSHFLMALAWGVTGACSRTTPDGKGAERLLRTGSDGNMVVGLQLEPLGWIERKKNGKHTLLLDWQDGVGVTKNQALLYDALGIPSETAMAIFDPAPILGKTPNDQRAAILRILRPSKIEVPASCKEAGIRALAGVEHIDQLIDERKTRNIRDLNAEIRVLNTRQPDPPPEKPRIDITEIEGKLNLATIELAKRQRELNQWEAVKLSFERVLQKPEPNPEWALTEGARDSLAVEQTAVHERISTLSTNLRELEAQWRATVAQAKQASITTTRLKTQAESARKTIAKLENSPDFECSAGECPIRQQRRDMAAKEIAETRNLLSEAQALLVEAEAAESKVVAEYEAMEDRQGALQVEMRNLQKRSEAITDTLSRNHQYLAEKAERDQADAKIAEAEENITRLRQERGSWQSTSTRLTEAAATFNEWKTKADARTKWAADIARVQANLADQQRIVDDLTALKKKLVGDKSEAFMGEMQRFLEPFGIGRLSYGFEEGFRCEGRAAELLSDGQRNMMFEAAFRSAVATITGIGIVVIDGIAPLTSDAQEKIHAALAASGHQVIECRTSDSGSTVLSEGSRVFMVSAGEIGLVATTAA